MMQSVANPSGPAGGSHAGGGALCLGRQSRLGQPFQQGRLAGAVVSDGQLEL